MKKNITLIKNSIQYIIKRRRNKMKKDVLEYTEEEFNELPNIALEELLLLAERGESLFDTQQMTEKILINSLN